MGLARGNQTDAPGPRAGDGRARPSLSRRAVLCRMGAAASGLVGAATLVACGAGNGRVGTASDTVKFVYGGDSAAQTRIRTDLSEFQRTTGSSVSLLPISDYYTQNVQAMVAAGVPPDVVYVSRPEFDALWPDGKLADLKPLLGSDPKQTSAFFPLTLQEWERDSKQLALPLGFRTFGIVYNVNAFQQAKLQGPPPHWNADGWSITDFTNAAKKLSFPGSASQDAQFGFYVDPTYPVWSAFVLNAGGEVLDAQNRTLRVDQPPAVAALGALQEVLLTAGITPPRDLVVQDAGANIFSNGSLGMTITDPSTVAERQRDSHFPWDVGVLPGDATNRRTTGTGAGYALVAGSKHTDVAWKLIQYLTSEQVQQREALAGQWIPSRPAVATSPAFLPEQNNVDLAPQHMKVFVEALSDNRVQLQPALKNWQAVRGALEAGIQELWTGQMKPDEAAKHMQEIAGPVLQQG